ncbi:RNA 2',3'-cyclic phosphodiesterase [Neobacillus muris]|uniref:RNA 2',3'-cyclic phosphodiesterase n=1 Tax=Neobacillus muris TaxID=2941334 RepID=UPI00203A9E4A|nr:RNA 2',3'-cyclic phosphodiesterase [Neobacillus muris]
METKSHYFFAAKIPDETKLFMKDHMETLKQSFPFSSWIHHQDLHITLAFLGSAEEEKLAAAYKNVNDSLIDEQKFLLKINKLGIFGKSESPRVFWADTEESPELHMIRRIVFTACEQAGFQLETRPFHPHITLARKWRGEGPFRVSMLDIWQQVQPEPLPFLVKEVVLYRTNLQSTPKYEIIKAFPLQS